MKIIQSIKPLTNIHNSLRKIADEVEAGEYDVESCTLIMGTDIFHLGTFKDEDAAEKAIWDMTYGIHKLMKQALDSD